METELTAYVTSKARRGRVQVKACQTIMRGKTLGTINDGVLRFYSPREYWNYKKCQMNYINMSRHVTQT